MFKPAMATDYAVDMLDVTVVGVEVKVINPNPFCPYSNSSQTTYMSLSIIPEYQGYREVRIKRDDAIIMKWVFPSYFIPWNGKSSNGAYVDIGNYTVEVAISSGGPNANSGLSSITVEPDVVAKKPLPGELITADSFNSTNFTAELHNERGIDSTAQNSVTFEFSSNPRGNFASPIGATAGIATSTLTPNTMVWSETNKPSGNVTSWVAESLPSNSELKYIYVIPQPGIDVSELRWDLPEPLTVMVWATSNQRGPDLPIEGVTDIFKANPSYSGGDSYSVEIDWGDGTKDTFIQFAGSGIGQRIHTYDSSYQGNHVRITMTVDGMVERSYAYGTETHDYAPDVEYIDINL